MRIPAQGPERQKIKLIVRKYQGARKAKTVERIHTADRGGSGNEATAKGLLGRTCFGRSGQWCGAPQDQ
jgi:hypothetical protein